MDLPVLKGYGDCKGILALKEFKEFKANRDYKAILGRKDLKVT